MTRITQRFTGIAALIALSCLSVALVGCSGDDGKDGAQGPAGSTGPTGPQGPEGPAGPPGVSIEDGGSVTIGDGSTLSEETLAAIGGLVATIDSGTIASPPVIEFTVKTVHGGAVLGLDAGVLNFMVAKLVPSTDGVPARWRSYVNRTQTSSSSGPQVLPSATQATTENGASGTLEELGDGQYRYTYGVDLDNVVDPIAVAYEPSLTHRLGFEIRMSGEAEALAPDNPVIDIVPDGGAGSGHKLIADTENCEACHVRFGMHGGPRRTVAYCVTCHNPGSIDPDGGESVDLAYLAHSIHAGENRPEAYIVYGFRGSEHNYGEVTYPQSVAFCETCHTASEAAPDGDAWMVNSSASACGGCHVDGLGKTGPDPDTGLYAYTYLHSFGGSPVTDGLCVNCHVDGGVAGATLAFHANDTERLRKTLGEDFVMEILGATNTGPGETPIITIKVSDAAGNPYDIINDPEFDSANGSALNLYVAFTTDDIVNGLDDGTLVGQRCTAPGTIQDRTDGYPYRMYLDCIKGSAADNGDGSYDVTYFAALPATGWSGDVMIALGGHPVAEVAPGDFERAAAESAVFYPGTPRVNLVEQAKCENCHEWISFHGGNRNGNPQICLVCHNPSGGFAADGIGPLAFGAFIHNIHAGNLFPVTFPQSIANCEACHAEGAYYAARSGAVPISTDGGADGTRWDDDLADSATAGTCGTCHSGTQAAAHMQQNGGFFDQPKTSLDPSSAYEACTVCHGPGRVADTAEAHAGHGE